MSSTGKISLKMGGLKLLQRRLESYKTVEIRAGLLGNRNDRLPTAKDPQPRATNGEIGFWHEFGTKFMPARSFIFFPLAYHLSEYLGEGQTVDESTIFDSANGVPELIRKSAQNCIRGAFENNGWGAWAPLNLYTLAHKSQNVGKILTEFGQLAKATSAKIFRK